MTTRSKFLWFLLHIVLVLFIRANAITGSVSKVTGAHLNVTACGFVKATDRLYGSHSAEIGEFPWVVAIEYKDSSTGQLNGTKCTGSLINNRYVLTAAHCLTKSNIEPFRVWLGDWKLSTDPDCQNFPDVICGHPVEKIAIDAKIVHERFSKGTGEHDIALLRLKYKVQFSDMIQPVCLSSKELTQQDRLVAVSWGGGSTDTLQSVTLPHVPIEECKTILNKTFSDNVFCAGGEKGRDTCRGDGGAPLVKALPFYDENSDDVDLRWFQYGITSWGIGCGNEGYPAVYTNVLKYKDWIDKNILPKVH